MLSRVLQHAGIITLCSCNRTCLRLELVDRALDPGANQKHIEPREHTVHLVTSLCSAQSIP